MANTTLISLTQIKENIGQIALRSHGCFGTHNSFNYQDLVDHRNRYASGNCRSVTAEMETIEFFPHISGDAIMSKVAKTVDFFNSIGVYARTFTTSPVNSIMANMRETPADKIFTGFMTLRQYLHGNFRAFSFMLTEGLSKEEEYLRRRIGLFLQMVGTSIDMFGRVAISDARSAGSEGTATFIPRGMDALAAYMFVYGTEEQCSDAFAQHPVGESPNENGYLRDGHNGLSRIRNERGYNHRDFNYASMSHWLQAWIMNDGHKPAELDARKGRLTVLQIIDRIRERIILLPNGGTDEQRTDIILNVFEELKDMYS